jgi:myosin-heavy-chain kinase
MKNNQQQQQQRAAVYAPAESVTVPATRYIYDLKKQAWVDVPINVCIPNPTKGFEAGGMRICFEVLEVDEHGHRSEMVAKFFRKNIDRVVEVDYFNEGAAQCMSEEFAQNFNLHLKRVDESRLAAVGGKCHISFLMCQVVRIRTIDLPPRLQANPALYGPNSFFTFRTTDKGEVMFVMEYKLKGTFTKYNNNFGEIYESSDAKKPISAEDERKRARVFQYSEAFSHFSLVESGGSMLVCDLQGVLDFFTDPQIHTEDGKGLGMGNMGQEGIDKWTSKHQCNTVCRAINLLDLWGRPNPDALPPAAVSVAQQQQQYPQQPQVAAQTPNAPILFQDSAPTSERRSHYDAFRLQPALFQPPPPPGTAVASSGAVGSPHDLLQNMSQYPQQQQGLASSGSGGAASPKSVRDMSEDEQIEYAIQQSMIGRH